MTPDEKLTLALKFLSILGKPDADVIRDVATEDMVWTFPGSAIISGEVRGSEAILQRARTIAAHKVKVEVIRPLYGLERLAVVLHNTAKEGDRLLDEHLAAVFTFRGTRIERLDTLLSDVPMVAAFFG